MMNRYDGRFKERFLFVFSSQQTHTKTQQDLGHLLVLEVLVECLRHLFSLVVLVALQLQLLFVQLAVLVSVEFEFLQSSLWLLRQVVPRKKKFSWKTKIFVWTRIITSVGCWGWVTVELAWKVGCSCVSTCVVVVMVSSTFFSSAWIWAVGAWTFSEGCSVIMISSLVSVTVTLG